MPPPSQMTNFASTDARRIRNIRNRLLAWAATNLRDYPWRRPDATPYGVLVAELLLKRTTATAASRLYPSFLDRFPDIETLAAASEPEIAHTLQPLGLSRQRASAMSQMAWQLQQQGGRIPKSLAALKKLPGLGDYAARAIQSFGYGARATVVDGNVDRILRRVFMTSIGADASAHTVLASAHDLLPRRRHREFNLALIDLGATVCLPRRPHCGRCPLQRVCDFSKGSRPATSASPLRKLRHDQGLSISALALESGVTRLTIINTEAHRTRPKQATVQKLAKALGVSTDSLAE